MAETVQAGPTLLIVGPQIPEEHRETVRMDSVVPVQANGRVRGFREEAQIIDLGTRAERSEDARNWPFLESPIAVPVCVTRLPVINDGAMVSQQIHQGHFRATNDYLCPSAIGIVHRVTKRMGHPNPPIDGKEVVMPWGAEFYGVLEPELVNETQWVKVARLGEPPDGTTSSARQSPLRHVEC